MKRSSIHEYDALVCYFDLLGTTRLFENAEAEDELYLDSKRLRYDASRMKCVANTMSDTLGKLPQGREEIANRKAGAYIFSDGAFFIGPVETFFNGKAKTDNEPEFSNFIWDLAECQTKLVRQGFILRGYVTIGKVFSGRNFLVGPAVCRAARGEKNVNGPFIGIDDKVLSFICEGYYRQQPWDSNETDPLKEMNIYGKLTKDTINKCACINYMWDWWSTEKDGETLFSEQKRLIEVNGPKTGESAKKYLPLAIYHNHIVNRLSFTKKQKLGFCVSEEVLTCLMQTASPQFLDPEKELESIKKSAYEKVRKEGK